MTEDPRDPTDHADLVADEVSSRRRRGMVFLGVGVAVGLYALVIDPQNRAVWIAAGLVLGTGLFRLLMAPLHGKALAYGARKGEERRRRRAAREERA